MAKIINIECFYLRYPYPKGIHYEYSGGLCENMDAALIRVTCDTGEYGLGEVTHGQMVYEPILGLVDHFRRLLVGSEVSEVNRAWELMYQSSIFWNRQGLAIGVMGGINMAMYDLWGKLLKLPVHTLLGGVVRERIRGYASNGLFNEPDPLIADTTRARDFGFTAYKMRIVHPETIGSQVAAFRQAFGRTMDLAVDAVQGSCAVPYALGVCKKIAKDLEPHDILWFEEPCRVENLEGYVELRQATSLNIAGAESIPTARAFKPYLDNEAFGMLQFDIATSGFTEGARIASLAAQYNRPVAIHSWGTIVSAMAGIHLSLTLPNCAITEYCFMDHPFNDKLSVEPVRPVEGYFTVPQGPGLGLTFDEAMAKEYPYNPGINTMISTEEKDILLQY
jgi:L-alanine-DL-glutamate epimerase-like enolase superfamily enzyme